MGFPQLEIRRGPYMRYIHDPWGLFKLSLVQYRLMALADPTTVGTQLEEKASLIFLLDPKLVRSEEHTSELQSRLHLVCRLLLEKKKTIKSIPTALASLQKYV